MLLRDDLNIAGRLTIRKYTLDGVLVQQVRNHNDITVAGRQLVANLFNKDFAGTGVARVSKVKVGSSQKAFDGSDTALGQEIGAVDIKTIEQAQVSDSANRKRFLLRIMAELGEKDCNGEIREAGLFTADAKPLMYNRVTFDTITKSNKFRLTLAWEIMF